MTTTIIRLEDFQKNMVFCVRNNTNHYIQNKLRVLKPEMGSYKRNGFQIKARIQRKTRSFGFKMLLEKREMSER